jgi:hypothetical protein
MTETNHVVIFIHVNDIDSIPDITISGDINCFLTYHFFDYLVTVWTTIDGIEVSREEYRVNLYDYGDLPILNAPNLDMNSFEMIYAQETNLTKLYSKGVDGSVYRSSDQYELIESGVLQSLISISNVEIIYTVSGEVTTIASGAFDNCKHITSVILTDTVTEIQSRAFQSFDIRTIYIPSSVTMIRENAFISMSMTLLMQSSDVQTSWENGWDNASSVSIIWGYLETRSNDDYIYAINQSNEITIIELINMSLSGEVVIPNTIEGLPVTQFISTTFKNNTQLISVVIPETIRKIPSLAFYGCDNLVSVTFESTSVLVSIGDNAFLNCYELVEISIPETVTYIGNLAFGNCFAITIYIDSHDQTTTWDNDWNASINGFNPNVVYGQ